MFESETNNGNYVSEKKKEKEINSIKTVMALVSIDF